MLGRGISPVHYSLLAIGIALMSALMAGCGGGGTCAVCFGAVRGYVYEPIGGGRAQVSANPTAPVGLEPVAVGTIVRIDGFPDLFTTTNIKGYYYIGGIPPGTRILVIEAAGGTLRLSIPIIGNRVTEGGGHVEGGGGT